MTSRELAWQNLSALPTEPNRFSIAALEQIADELEGGALLDDEEWIVAATDALWRCGLGHRAERLLQLSRGSFSTEQAIRVAMRATRNRDVFRESTTLSIYEHHSELVARLEIQSEMDIAFHVRYNLLCLYARTDTQKLYEQVNELHELYPRRFDFLNGRLRERFAANDYDWIIENKRRIEEVEYGVAYFMLAVAYLRSGHIDASEAVLRTMSARGLMHEVDVGAFQALVEEIRRIRLAIERLTNCASSDQSLDRVEGCVIVEGGLLKKKKFYSHLNALLPPILENFGQAPLILGFAAEIREQFDDRSGAMRLYERAFFAGEGRVSARELAGWCERVAVLYVREFNVDGAEVWSRRAVALEETEARLTQLAKILEGKNQFGESLSIYERLDGTRARQGRAANEAVLQGLLRSAHALAGREIASAPARLRVEETVSPRRVVRVIFGFGPVGGVAFHADPTIYDEIWVADFLTGRLSGSKASTAGDDPLGWETQEELPSVAAVAAERPHAGPTSQLVHLLHELAARLESALRPHDIVVFSSRDEWLLPEVVRRTVAEIDIGYAGHSLSLKYRPFRPNVVDVGREESRGPFIVRASKLVEAGPAILRFSPPPTVGLRLENAGLHIPLLCEPEQMASFFVHETAYRRFRNGESPEFWRDMLTRLQSGTADVASLGRFVVLPPESCALQGWTGAPLARWMIELDGASAARAYAAFVDARAPSLRL